MRSDKLFILCINQNKSPKKYTKTELSLSNYKMDTIFMNSWNSKISKPHVLILKLTNKLDLRIGKKIIALSNLSIYYTWKNIKNSYNNNKFKISAPTWTDMAWWIVFCIRYSRLFWVLFKKKNMEKMLINLQYRYM